MAVIKHIESVEESINYIASLALLCCVSCVVIMLKFGGFKATFNLYSRNKKKEHNEPTISLSGAYRSSRDEFFGYSSLSEPPKKISPSMVTIPTSQSQAVRPSKSTGDLTKADNAPANLRQSFPAISLDPRGAEEPTVRKNSRDVRKQEKEQKKVEKKRLAEQKAKDKLAAQEQAKQEKLRKEREQKEAQKKKKKEEKKKAPAPPTQRANPLAQGTSNSTNTLESSISKSSGPPPYSEDPEPTRSRTKSSEKADNVIFSKPIDSGGNWDMISQHRQQISRPAAAVGSRQPKQMVMDLNYNFGGNSSTRTHNDSNDNDNSEA